MVEPPHMGVATRVRSVSILTGGKLSMMEQNLMELQNMSSTVFNRVIGAQILPSTKSVLMAIAYDADDTGFCESVSIAHICSVCCISRRTAFYAIGSLEKSGLITVFRTESKESSFQINLDSTEFDQSYCEWEG